MKERKLCIARENKEAHRTVHALVPMETLEKAAKDKFKLLFNEDSQLPLTLLRDLSVHELVKWFKNDFFSWVDKLKCDICNIDMMAIEGHLLQDEIQDGAVNVEVYRCSNCSRTQRFPRYELKIKSDSI